MDEQLALTPQSGVILEARKFFDAHPGSEHFILKLALRDGNQDRPLSMDFYCHCLRRSGILPPGVGHNFTLNDHVTSLFARYFKEVYGLPFRTRASQYDDPGSL